METYLPVKEVHNIFVWKGIEDIFRYILFLSNVQVKCQRAITQILLAV